MSLFRLQWMLPCYSTAIEMGVNYAVFGFQISSCQLKCLVIFVISRGPGGKLQTSLYVEWSLYANPEWDCDVIRNITSFTIVTIIDASRFTYD